MWAVGWSVDHLLIKFELSLAVVLWTEWMFLWIRSPREPHELNDFILSGLKYMHGISKFIKYTEVQKVYILQQSQILGNPTQCQVHVQHLGEGHNKHTHCRKSDLWLVLAVFSSVSSSSYNIPTHKQIIHDIVWALWHCVSIMTSLELTSCCRSLFSLSLPCSLTTVNAMQKILYNCNEPSGCFILTPEGPRIIILLSCHYLMRGGGGGSWHWIISLKEEGEGGRGE